MKLMKRKWRPTDIIDMARGLAKLDREAQKGDLFPVTEGDGKARDLSISRNPIIRKRQTQDEDDPFRSAQNANYGTNGLLEPSWNPWTLYRIFEESDILQACVAAYRDNLARPYDLEYCGPKGGQTETGAVANEKKLRSFLSRVNEKHSWLTVTRKKEMDFWAVGNAYLEVLEDLKTFEPLMIYNAPPAFMRVTKLDEEPILVDVKLPRNGEIVERPVYRQFRRFARWLPSQKIQWFREFGDPRLVDKNTGNYITRGGRYVLEKDVSPEDYPERATSIWWFRNAYGGNVYGVPPWVSCIAEIKGRYLASWVNYDLLDHGGTPPWLLLIFGRMAEASKKFWKKWVDNLRNPASYNEPAVVEIEPNLLSFNSNGGAKAGAEFVNLREMRNTDAMFTEYRKETRATVGSVYRLPPVLYGIVEGAGGTNYAAIETAETQVFEPLRNASDERYNVELVQAKFGIFDWRIKTKRSPMTGEAFGKIAMAAARTGGPSLNDMTLLHNEMFGTNWPIRDHWFYSKISAAEAVGMVRSGQVSYDNETGDPVVHPPAQAGQPQENPLEALGKLKAASDGKVIDALQPLANFLNLYQAMQGIEKDVAEYKPHEHTDEDFQM